MDPQIDSNLTAQTKTRYNRIAPGGEILPLEHVRIDRPVIGFIVDIMNPFPLRFIGLNINRRIGPFSEGVRVLERRCSAGPKRFS